MASDSATGFLKRNRPPRVNISYEDPHNADANVELPFVMGVMADLSGNASEVDKAPMSERTFTQVDTDNFDDYMASVEPQVAFACDNKLSDSDEKLSVNVKLKGMKDLDPAEVAKQVPALRKLLEARQQLSNLQSFMNGKAGAQDLLRKLLDDPELMAALDKKRAETEKDAPNDDDVQTSGGP